MVIQIYGSIFIIVNTSSNRHLRKIIININYPEITCFNKHHTNPHLLGHKLIRGAEGVDYFARTGKIAGDRAGMTASNGKLFYLLLKDNPQKK